MTTNKPKIRCFTRSLISILKEIPKKSIHETWLKDKSVGIGYATTANKSQVNYFYDLRV